MLLLAGFCLQIYMIIFSFFLTITSNSVLLIFFSQIVSAVQYCHQRRIVHRDLKVRPKPLVLSHVHFLSTHICECCVSLLSRSPVRPRTCC